MSPIWRTRTAAVAALAACALLSGCSGSGSQEPSAGHRSRPHASRTTSAATEPTSGATSSSPTSAPPATSLLRFSPRSGGKHLEDCQRLEPGDDPAEFVYYPVLVTAQSPVTLDSVGTDHTQGVVDAAAWVAPAGPTPETGTFKGWPPRYVARDPNLQWSKRVPAAGASLAAGTTYNVFLRLQVDPTPGDSSVTGVVFAYHDTGGAHSDTWRATTTFSMSC
jgi:hypothetical protein